MIACFTRIQLEQIALQSSKSKHRKTMVTNQSILLLSLRDFIGIVSLTGVLFIIAAIFFLIASSLFSESGKEMKKRIQKRRIVFFVGFGIFLATLLMFSFSVLPYPEYHGKPDKIVSVVAIQWDWVMGMGVTDKTPAEFSGYNEISLPVNKRIKFIVTSGDVNHNFGIYNNKGVLLAQTQAMPQYRNELVYAFTQKGDYFILCLEYCGLGHGFMMGTIHVK